MALKFCPNCGNPVSEFAKRCPNCNCELPQNFNNNAFDTTGSKPSKGMWIALYVILGLILAAIIFIGVSYYLGEKREAELAAQEKLRRDSIAQAELAEAEEQARLQDSIARAEEANPFVSLATFCTPHIVQYNDMETGADKRGQLYNFKENSQIESILKSLGFTCHARNTSREYNEIDGEYYTKVSWVYVKSTAVGPLTVKDNGESYIDISFHSATAANAFMSSLKSIGFKYNKDWEGYILPANKSVYWEGITVKAYGNNVRITQLWEA